MRRKHLKTAALFMSFSLVMTQGVYAAEPEAGSAIPETQQEIAEKTEYETASAETEAEESSFCEEEEASVEVSEEIRETTEDSSVEQITSESEMIPTEEEPLTEEATPTEEGTEEETSTEEEAEGETSTEEETEGETLAEEETEGETLAEEETKEEALTEEQINAELYTGAAFSIIANTNVGTVAPYVHNGKTYLFMPNYGQNKNTFSYTGDVKSVSVGTLDKANHVITLDIKDSQDITFVMLDGTRKTITVMQSSVPTVSIILKGTSLAAIQADKDKKHSGNTVVVTGDNPFIAENVEMKGRGNSSWLFTDKKGYQIKFEKKTSVLGLPEAKKWCLIANANDGSLMRNKLAYELADYGDFAYTPDCEFVDLWVDGVYQGLYTITSKVEIGKNRLNLKDEKGVLVEMDNYFYKSEDVWRASRISGMHYVLKEAVDESSTAGFESFMSAMEQLESCLWNNAGWSQISSLIDARSFADFYLVNELLQNRECAVTSLYYYKDGDSDVIHAGPVWDFDTCLGSQGETPDSYYFANSGGPGTSATDIFARLAGYPEYIQLVKEVYEENYQSLYPELEKKLNEWYAQIKNSADMNFTKWDNVLGSVSQKGDTILGTVKANVDYIRNWLKSRFQLFVPNAVVVSSDHYSGSSVIRTLTLRDAANVTSDCRVAVWSEVNGQDDLVWYPMTKTSDGYTVSINLSNHHSTGGFQAHFYGRYRSNGEYKMMGNLGFSYTKQTTQTTLQYAAVFDADYYSSRYPDLKKAFGTNRDLLYQHFLTFGMKEGRQASAKFCLDYYKKNYADLSAHFGSDNMAYYTHYIRYGIAENRVADRLLGGSNSVNPSFSAIFEGVDYSPVFDADYYLQRYADLRAAFGTDKNAALQHFVRFGMSEARVAKSTFNVKNYYKRYADLRAAFGSVWSAYFKHFLTFGLSENRNGK